MNHNEHKRLLRHFLPLSHWLRETPHLILDVLEAILELPSGSIIIDPMFSSDRPDQTKSIDHWRVEIDSVIGGKFPMQKKRVGVSLAIPVNNKITDYLPGGSKRTFLEEQLYPNFFGENVDCHTQVISEEGSRFFLVGSDDHHGRVGISTMI